MLGIGGGRHGPLSNFSDRLLEKMQKDVIPTTAEFSLRVPVLDQGLAPASEPAIAVDPLSLCSLMSQGDDISHGLPVVLLLSIVIVKCCYVSV